MAARSIASLTLGFGLVSIPVKLYSATESSSAIRFKLMSADGGGFFQSRSPVATLLCSTIARAQQAHHRKDLP